MKIILFIVVFLVISLRVPYLHAYGTADESLGVADVVPAGKPRVCGIGSKTYVMSVFRLPKVYQTAADISVESRYAMYVGDIEAISMRLDTDLVWHQKGDKLVVFVEVPKLSDGEIGQIHLAIHAWTESGLEVKVMPPLKIGRAKPATKRSK